MKISGTLNKAKTSYNIGFKSERTDKATVSRLKSGDCVILENNRQNILEALKSLSVNSPQKQNISLLLDVADGLAYGEFGNAKFKAELDRDGITTGKRENTDWSEILKDTIQKAISVSQEDVSDLEEEFKRVFSEKTELTAEQKNLLELRKNLTKAITDKSLLKTTEDIENAATARKNLDYFTASSEIPLKQKIECLERLIHFMSDNYKINPQLADKKIRVISEILNDIVIKTPESKELTIKSVDQRITGICAAISICRKAMAYEDKTAFIDIITEELKDSPVMSVYDVTELGSGKKVEIPKIDVDYKSALNKGYRIIDASAHIWMNNAHASGDGTIQTEHYVPFDDDNYGVFDDSSWYLGLDEELSEEKILLNALIKEVEYIKSIQDTKKSTDKVHSTINEVRTEAVSIIRLAITALNNMLAEIFRNKNPEEISQLINSLIDFYTQKTNDNEIHISEKMSDEMKAEVISNFIIKSVPDCSEEQKTQIKNKAKSINGAIDEYISSDKKIKNLKKFGTQKGKYIYNKKLYKAAAAHRLAMEADVNIADGVYRFERYIGLPVRSRQIINHILKEGKKTGSQEAYKDAMKIEAVIPAQIDSILHTLTDKKTANIVADILKDKQENIKKGDKQALEGAVSEFELEKKDKNKTLKLLEKLILKMESNPSRDEINDVIRQLGFDNELDFAAYIISSSVESCREGISDKEYNRLAKIFGGKDKISNGLIKIQKKFIQLTDTYDEIIKKWHVPSAREFIIKKLEQNKEILSREKLNILQSRFAKIEKEQAKNEQIQNMKEREKADNKLYTFTREEEEIFRQIEKELPKMKRYSYLQYKNLNGYLFSTLEEQYSTIGMLNGQFWVREDGSSGLTSNEQVRILEQMTGKPYHIEKDIKEAAKEIKKGKGSGIISLSVDDEDYAFHAQYVPEVTEEIFSTQDGSDAEIKDVIWTDNSWGLAEKEHFWIGKDGYRYTDYNRGFGWKNGFLLGDDLKIGLPVDDIFGATGTEKEEKTDFGLFSDIILPGRSIKTNQKLMKMFNYIFGMQEGEKTLRKLEEMIENGAKINIDFISKLDDAAEAKCEALDKRIKNEIHSREDFDKLKGDDPIKFEFKKIALYLASGNPEIANTVLSVKTPEEFNDAYEEIVDAHLDIMGAVIAKSASCIDTVFEYSMPEIKKLLKELENQFGVNIPEEDQEQFMKDVFNVQEKMLENDGSIDEFEKNIVSAVPSAALKYIKDEKAREYFETQVKKIIQNTVDEQIKITSLDSPAIKENPLGEKLIEAIDKYLQPASDEDLLDILKDFQHLTFESVENFMDCLSDEDLGLKIKEPYDYVKLYKAEDSAVTKAFTEVIGSSVIFQHLPASDDEEDDTPEELYRALHIKLSDMDVQKYIKSFKDEAFQKYRVRQAFPQPVVLDDKEIENMTDGVIQMIKSSIDDIENNKGVINLIKKYDHIYSYYFRDEKLKPLLKGKNMEIKSLDTEFLSEFKKEINDLYNIVKNNSGFEYILESIEGLKNQLEDNSAYIYGKFFSEYMNKIISFFKDLENTDITVQKFKEINESILKNIKSSVSIIVNANVEPKYRDEVVKTIKELTRSYKKRGNSQETKHLEEKIVSLIKEKHIVKNPTVLLSEYVKMLQSKKYEEKEKNILRDYLLSTIQVALQTKIQYKLIQNQHEGISSKTKDLLPIFSLSLTDGTERNITSDEGILYFINQLNNYSDNNVILKLFLAQTGLGKAAVRAMINELNPQEINDYLKTQAEKTVKNISDVNIIADESNKFFTQSQIKYKSVKDCIEQYKQFMKNRLGHYESSDLFTEFLEFFDNIEGLDNMNGSSIEICNQCLGEMYVAALENPANSINEQIEELDKYGQILESKLALLNSIEIPETSEEYKKREEFNQNTEQLNQALEETANQITNALANCSVLAQVSEE